MITQVALIFLGCVVSALLTLGVLYLRDLRAQFRDSQAAQDAAIEKLEDRMNELPEKYLFREDFIRWSISVDKKIDDLADNIQTLLKGGVGCLQKTAK